MTHAECWAAWRVDGELAGGHSVEQTLAWASWTGDVEDEHVQRHAPPVGVVSPDLEPWWLTRLRARFGR